MNFLAHLYLSGEEDEIRIGNFIGDHVKGKNYEKYPEKIKQGILLHREIDHFTDHHPVVHQSKAHLNDRYGKYSGIIVDIFYDHFLASNWQKYSPVLLQDFIHEFHKVILKHFTILPSRVKQYVPFFVINNWIQSYESVEGIESVLLRMSRRTSLPDETRYAVEELNEYYHLFLGEFSDYFIELIAHVESYMGFRLQR